MGRLSTALIKVLLAAMAAVWIYQAAARPVTAEEAVLYQRFVQRPLRETFLLHDVAPSIVYAAAARRSAGLLRLSEFSLRLPSVLAGFAALWAVYKLLRRSVWIGSASLAAVAVMFHSFSLADGQSLGLAALLWAVVHFRAYLQCSEEDKLANLNLGAVLAGLAAAADLKFALPAGVAVAGLAVTGVPWRAWSERVLVPAVVTPFLILILSLSHATALDLRRDWATPSTPTTNDAAIRAAARELREQTGGRSARIEADEGLLPSLAFYKAAFRMRNWTFESPADVYIGGSPVRINRRGAFQPPGEAGRRD